MSHLQAWAEAAAAMTMEHWEQRQIILDAARERAEQTGHDDLADAFGTAACLHRLAKPVNQRVGAAHQERER